jgi:multiple sugar transport system permease protein
MLNHIRQDVDVWQNGGEFTDANGKIIFNSPGTVAAYKSALLLKICGILLAVVIFLFPVYWMIVASFKSNRVLMKLPPQLYPTFTQPDNYISILTEPRYLTFIKNSLIVTVSAVLICFVLSILAGYSLSRYHFPLRKTLMSILLSVQMFPVVAILISLLNSSKN